MLPTKAEQVSDDRACATRLRLKDHDAVTARSRSKGSQASAATTKTALEHRGGGIVSATTDWKA
jgi:hypothetical protein